MCTKFDLRLKKNKKIFGPNFQNYLKNFLCRHQKNTSHTISIYGNCMIGIFFKKRKPQFFYHQTVLLEISHRNKFIPVFNHL